MPSALEMEMWDDFEENNVDFSCGVDTTAEERCHLERAINNLALWNTSLEDTKQAEQEELEVAVQWRRALEEDDELAEIMERSELEDVEPEPDADIVPDSVASAGWFPYPNKTMMLLDTLDNLPRVAVSGSLMRVFLWILRETGARDVPSFDGLHKLQKKLRDQCGIPTNPYKSPRGNVFYYNDPRAIVAKDWSTPCIRKEIRCYPVIPNSVISEVWHAEKWHKELDASILSPMYDAGNGRHYYVQELACLQNDELVIPVRWLETEQTREVYADAYCVRLDEKGTAVVETSITTLIKASELRFNFIDLQEAGFVPSKFSSSTQSQWEIKMPNALRAIADGDPLYTSFVDYWSDDVSGNRSKSYNKHWNGCITHHNLPRRLLQQECHIHLVSTSQHATASEQFKAFKEAVESTHDEPVRVRDAATGEATGFWIFVNAEPGDNPSQSECSGHIGGQGNFPFRKCKVGGTDKEKEADHGYHALFSPGEARSAAETLHEVKRQLAEDRNRSAASIQAELKAWVEAHQDDIINPFLTMKGFDPTKDTPVEILHTILLGIIKYIWHMTQTGWKDIQKETYTIRLQSTAIDSLATHPIRAQYIMQYANSLIGRQLKTVAQTTTFHVYDLMDATHFQLWKACGELTALLWFPEIQDQEEYMNDLDIVIGNVLDLFSVIDPSKMVQKIKLHLLSHMREDVRRLGPLLGSITESFESYNAVFHYSSIFSNGLAPSRDIAIDLAGQESLKHRLFGRFWPSKDSGTIRLVAMKRKTRERPTVHWEDTKAAHAVNAQLYGSALTWTPCVHLIAKSRDKCTVGSWICGTSPINILSSGSAKSSIIVLDQFDIAETHDPTFGMPTLHRRLGETTYIIMSTFMYPQQVDFSINVQHNCQKCRCSASGKRQRKQERQDSGLTEQFIEHKEDDHFIINTHSLHNPHLLRQLLPRHLTAPIALFKERQCKHAELAAQLRTFQDAK
ncbi:hypothetical protein BKA93DRAFT_746070 [Sparassis latifolia]